MSSDVTRRGAWARMSGVVGSLVAMAVPVLVWLSVPASASSGSIPAVSVQPTVGDVIEVRPDRVDLMVDGRVASQVAYPAGPLTISALVELVARPSWLRRVGDTVELRAGLFQAPETNLVFAGRAVKRVLLIRDPSGVGGTVRGTAAAVSFQGVSVTGWDGADGEPAVESAQRPYLYYVHGSSVVASDSTFTYLGRPAPGGHGVTLGSETTGSLTRTTFSHSYAGLSLVGTGAVTVTNSAARDNSTDGVFVKAAIPVQLQGVTSTGNAGYGILVQQARATRLIGIALSGNSNGGVRLVDASQTTLSDVTSAAEAVGLLVDGRSSVVSGVSITSAGDDEAVVVGADTSRVTLAGVKAQRSRLVALDLAGKSVRVSGAVVTRAPTAVSFTHASGDIRLSDSTISDVGVGVDVRAAAHRVVLSSLAITNVRDIAVRVSSTGIAMRSLQIDTAAVGVRFYGAVDSATLADSRIAKAATGILIVHGVRGVSLRDVAISGASTGLSSATSNLQVSGGSIGNSTIAMRLSGRGTVSGIDISGAKEGLRVGHDAVIDAAGIHMSAAGLGLRVAMGGHLSIRDSVIGARTLSLGPVTFGQNNSLPAEKLRWYGLAAVVAAGSALLLETVRRLREKPEDGTWLLPAGVLNTR